MRRYGGGMLYAVLPLHMQRGCFRIRTHDEQVIKTQLYRCTKGTIKMKKLEAMKSCTSTRALQDFHSHSIFIHSGWINKFQMKYIFPSEVAKLISNLYIFYITFMLRELLVNHFQD